MNEQEPLCDSTKVARLSMAYSEVVANATAMHHGLWIASNPLGELVAVQIPEAQWRKLAEEICAITGGEVV